MHEPPDLARLSGRLEHRVRAGDVRLGELQRVAEGVVDVALRSEVQHSVDLVARHHIAHLHGHRVVDITAEMGERERERESKGKHAGR